MEHQSMNNSTQPLTRHTYPLWIKFGLTTCLVFFFICMKDLPCYFSLNNKIKSASLAFKNKNYQEARVQYAELSSILPDSSHIKMRAAQSFFKSPHRNDHALAAGYMKQLSLNATEMNELISYIPEEYKESITDIKEVRS